RVVGRGQVFYRDLLLREDKDAAVDAQTATRVLVEWARPRVMELLAGDEKAQRWLDRVQLLARAMPERGLPEDISSLANEALAAAAQGKRSANDLRAALLPAMLDQFPYPQQRLIESEAPETITVPTGNRIALA